MGDIGGAETNLERWIDYFRLKFGYEFVLLGPGDGVFFEKLAAKGVPCIKTEIPDWRKGKNFFYRYMVARKMRSILGKERFDFIFVNDFFYAPYGILLGKSMNIPVVVHIQSDSEPKRINQYKLNKANALITTTKSTLLRLTPFFKENSIVKLYLIPYGVKEKKEIDLRKSDFSKKKTVFGIAANILPHKGINMFFNILKELKEQDGWEIHWAGYDTQNRRSELEQEIIRMGLAHRVFFLGFLEEMSDFYTSIDCLIHLAEFEPFGIVLIEAMSYRLPVIATRTAGGEEVLGDIENGSLLVPINDAGSMAEKMMDLVNKKINIDNISHLLKNKFNTEYSDEISMKKMKKCFDDVLLSGKENRKTKNES
jgi:glycosyltransferase involved in cell wall biosynthesis